MDFIDLFAESRWGFNNVSPYLVLILFHMPYFYLVIFEQNIESVSQIALYLI